MSKSEIVKGGEDSRNSEYTKALLDAIPDMLFRLKADGTILEFKAPLEDLLIPPDSLVGTNIDDVPFGNDIRNGLKAAIAETLKTRTLYQGGYTLFDEDGKVHHYETRFVCSGEDEVVCISRDITELKMAQERLECQRIMLEVQNMELEKQRAMYEEKARLFKDVLDGISAGIVAVDLRGEVIVSNPAMEEFVGGDDCFVERMRDGDLLLHLDGEKVAPSDQPAQQVLASSKRFEGDFLLRSSDGTDRVMRVASSPLRSRSNKLRGALTFMMDMTHDYELSKALALSESRTRALLELVPDVVAEYDGDGHVLSMRGGKSFFSDVDMSAMVGMHIFDLPAPREQAERFLAVLRKTIDTGDLQVFMEDVQIFGGEGICSVEVRCVKSGEDRVVCVIRDVTEEKRSKEATRTYMLRLEEFNRKFRAQAGQLKVQARDLRAARDKARDATRTKSEFLANMSHEIRTPMTAILGYSELLTEQGLDDTLRHDYVRTIQKNGEHLLEIINDILDLSKIESGRLSMEKIVCSPTRILREVVALMLPRAQGKNLYLRSEVHSPSPDQVTTDPTRLRQILINLIGNAIKFTELGGVTVHMGADPEEGVLIVEVVDTGIGIPESKIDHIFKAFTQADASTTRKSGGTGLGLLISRKFARMLGGDLSAESVVGEGSCFSLSLGLGPEEAIRLDEPSLSRSSSSSRAIRSRTVAEGTLEGRVLLAEDGEDNRRLISHLLTRAGVSVEFAENGRIAYEKAIEASTLGTPFDLILMDMQMPEMDGYEATTRLRNEGYKAPIVALTAHAMSSDREKCLNAGCDDFETKPVRKQRLQSVLEKFVSRED